MKKRFDLSRHLLALLCLSFIGCAGMGRGCSSWSAQNFGADWVVVQADLNGKPFRCWELRDVSVSNEGASDGIYWKDSGGNLVHIAGHYNRVQVMSGNWDSAFKSIGLTQAACEAVHARVFDPATNEYVTPKN